MVTVLLSSAFAASFFVSTGPEVPLVGGGWAHATPAAEGWNLLFSAGGTYWRLPMGADLAVEDRNRQDLTGRTDLYDHAVVPCPDGTWLHLASASAAALDDSAWAFRYDADFQLLDATLAVSPDLGVRTNDMALLCAQDELAWVGFTGGDPRQSVFALRGDAGLDLVVADGELPQLMGGSLVYEPERGTVMAIGRAYGQPLHGARIGPDGGVEAYDIELPLAAEGEDAYWSSSTVRIGDHYVVAYMWRVDDGSFEVDEGNVRLAVFDVDWALQEVYPVTSYTAPNGAMRPALAVKDDQLLVLWDRDTTAHGALVTLDLVAFGAADEPGGDSGGDTGTPDDGDTGTPDDGDTGTPDDGGADDGGADDDGTPGGGAGADVSGGCAVVPARSRTGGPGGASIALALAGLVLARRRR